MLKKSLNVTLQIFVFLVLVLCIWGLYWVVKSLIAQFALLNPNVAAAIVAGTATTAVSIASLLLTRTFERKTQLTKEHREKKVPVYEELINFMARILFGERFGTSPTPEETGKFFIDFSQKLTIWGSDNVLKQFSLFRQVVLRTNPDDSIKQGIDTMLEYERLVLAIRKDLGHNNRNIVAGDILRLWVNDIDDHIGSTSNLT